MQQSIGWFQTLGTQFCQTKGECHPVFTRIERTIQCNLEADVQDP